LKQIGIGGKISEGRRIAHAPKAMEGERWYGTYFLRHFSIYLSYFLAKLQILADVATRAMDLTGLENCEYQFMYLKKHSMQKLG
jgi:hypothetical protein